MGRRRILMQIPKRIWRVLIVDDDPIILRPMRRVLSFNLKDQVIIDLANDGAHGLGKVDADLDILITDYQMPGMNGPELIQRARQINAGLKVVLMSGDTGAADRLAKAAGDHTIHTMDKPCSGQVRLELLATLRT